MPQTLAECKDTHAIRKLIEAYGERLSDLTTREKYQLVEVIAGYLLSVAPHVDNPGDETWSLLDQVKDGYDISENVTAIAFILKDEKDETLADMLIAIAAFTRDAR